MSETKKSTAGFSADEKAAMKERAKELKTQATNAESEKAVLATIAKMAEPDRTTATKIHEMVMATAPDLAAKTWYGSPAWNRDGKVILFFQDAKKFKTRYATLGFSEEAKLDDGSMWPTSFALPQLTAADEKKLAALIKKAVGA